MSADDGVYIHKFRNGWRVVHGQCLENAFESSQAMRDYFSGSPLFKTEESAQKYARKLYKKAIDDFGYVEYGINEV